MSEQIKDKPAKHPGGRPAKWNREMADLVIYLMETTTLNGQQIAEKVGIDRSAVYRWMHEDSKFHERYYEARAKQLENIGNELIEYSDTQDPIVGDRSDPARVRWLETRIKTRQWMLSKVLSAQYGDKLDINANVSFSVPQIVTATVVPAIKPGNQRALTAGTDTTTDTKQPAE